MAGLGDDGVERGELAGDVLTTGLSGADAGNKNECAWAKQGVWEMQLCTSKMMDKLRASEAYNGRRNEARGDAELWSWVKSGVEEAPVVVKMSRDVHGCGGSNSGSEGSSGWLCCWNLAGAELGQSGNDGVAVEQPGGERGCDVGAFAMGDKGVL